jgi:hypothetical protein
VKGTLDSLPGNNPVQPASSARAKMFTAEKTPAILSPVCVYTEDEPPASCAATTVAPGNGSSSSDGAAPASTSASLKPRCEIQPSKARPKRHSARRRFTSHYVQS